MYAYFHNFDILQNLPHSMKSFLLSNTVIGKNREPLLLPTCPLPSSLHTMEIPFSRYNMEIPLPPLTHVILSDFAALKFPLSPFLQLPLVCFKACVHEIDYEKLPRTLQYLILPYCKSPIFSTLSLPPSLVHLQLGNIHNSGVYRIINFFYLFLMFFLIVPGALPPTLRILSFNPKYDNDLQ